MTKTTMRPPIRRDHQPLPSGTAKSALRSGYRREQRPRELNWPLLLGTLLAIPALATALYFWHDHQIRRLATSLIAHADQAVAREDWRAAADAYYRAWKIQQDPALVEKLAPAYDKAYPGSRRGVIAFYQRALGTAEGSGEDLRVRLAELLYREELFEQSVLQTEKVLASQPDNLEAIKWRALATLGQHRNGQTIGVETVRQQLARAHALHPKNLELAVQFAQFLRQPSPYGAGDTGTADQVMDQLVSASPNDPQPLLARYHYRQSYKLPGAQRDLDIAVGLAPNDPDVVLAAARDAIRDANRTKNQSDYLVARELFRRLIEMQPERVDGYLGLGDVLYSSGERDQQLAAIAQWKQGQQQAGANASLLVRIAEATIQLGDFAEAATALDDVDAYLSSPQHRHDPYRRWAVTSLSYLRGLWHLEQDRPHGALPHLEEAAKSVRGAANQQNTAYNAQLALGRTWSRVRRPEQAAIVFAEILKQHPESAAALLGGAQAYGELGDPAEAIRYLQRLPLAVQQLADARLLKLKSNIQLQQREDPQQRNWSAAEQALREAQQHLRDNWQVPLLEAELRALQGRPSVALSILVEVASRYGQEVELALRLPYLYEAIGFSQQANLAWEQLRQRTGDTSQVALVAFRIAMLRRDWTTAAKVQPHVVLDELHRADQITFAQLQTRLQMELAPDAVDTRLWDLARAWPHETWPLVALLDRRLDGTSSDNAPATSQLLQELQRRTGESEAIWQYFSTWSLLQAEPPQTSAIDERIGLLRGKLPRWHRTHQIVASWQARQGNAEEATATRALATRCKTQRDPIRWADPGHLEADGELRREAVECWQVGSLERARERFRTLSTRDQPEPHDVFMLALCEQRLGNWSRAADRLDELAQKWGSARRWAALCECRLQLGQYDRAEQTLNHWQDHTGNTPKLVQLRGQLRSQRGWQGDPKRLVEDFALGFLVPSTRTELPRKIVQIAEIYFQLEDADSAERWLQMLDTSPPETFARAGWLRYRFNPQSAVETCLTAWQAHREPEPMVLLARLLSSDEDATPRAEACWSALAEALTEYEQHLPLAFATARLCQVRPAPQSLADQAERVLAQQRSQAGAWEHLAARALQAKQLQRAAKLSDRAASASIWPSAQILTTQGQLQLAQGKTAAAIATLKQARDVAPQPVTLYTLAVALGQTDDRNAAQTALQEAEQLLPLSEWNHPLRDTVLQLKSQLADEQP